jgi:hypothetical protein
MKSPILILTGMHRSGTSLVSNYMQKCGICMGENMIKANSGNPLGYFEDQDFLDFHKSVMLFNNLPLFPSLDDDINICFNNQQKGKALKILASKANKSEWGWKDPRTVFFLNFWNELAEECFFVFLFRHPLCVLDSLLRRATDKVLLDTPLLSIESWLIYNRLMLEFISQNPNCSCLFEIEDLINDPSILVSEARCHNIHLNASEFDSVFRKNSFSNKKKLKCEVSYEKFLDKKIYLAALDIYNDLKRKKTAK